MSEEGAVEAEGGWQPSQWTLPRAAAVDNLADTLAGRGFSESAVRGLARAAVRPDEMRRKLADVAELRVQGGTLSIVETRLWSASVVPHPANPREYGRRTYALGGRGAGLAMPEPVSGPDHCAELEIRVDSPNVLAQRLEDTKGRLVKENPLREDIGVEGVLQPLTVVSMTVHHHDGRPSETMLIAADGSSRISAVHDLLGYAPAKVAYEWGKDDRKFRREVNSLVRLTQKVGWENLSETDQAKVRVLTVPARVVVGFVSDHRAQLRFHTAVRNFIGLTHIRPPKPYSPAVENEAKADAVLDTLAEPTRTRPARITAAEKRWFAGTITAQEAVDEGCSRDRDVRAGEIVRAVLGAGTARRVNDGIRSLTAKQKPTREDRVDIAVELILRPVRTEENDDPHFIRPRRAVLQRAYRLPEIDSLPHDSPLEGVAEAGRSLEELRDDALEEMNGGLGDNGRLGVAQTELAVKAAYYMALAKPMALQRELFGGPDDNDDRTAVAVLRAMLSRRRGVLQAYEIVRAGRLGLKLYEVDEDGLVPRSSEGARELTNDRVRHTYNGETLEKAASGFKAASLRWADVTVSVDRLKGAVDVLRTVPVDLGGASLVERDGWDSLEVTALRSKLDRISRTLADWADRYDDRRGAEATEPEEGT
ncbi:hypothetical protein [Streptomyces sp. CBMA123]|uniref:hypothetical protein n=1 Tax=Streptomyces sp. CBMA123 TaxID=1896313 RepID=UPI001661F9C8|nr:hypothetical protein [Streptomyces sp. CBMA123]MBD0694728.1 hypothetical protein [Streptomyces sp. CBMA123]